MKCKSSTPLKSWQHAPATLINNEGNIVGLIVEQTVSIMEIVDYHK